MRSESGIKSCIGQSCFGYKVVKEKRKQNSQKINNIRNGSIIIRKWIIIKKLDHDFENHIYSITTTTQSWKRDFKTKKL